MKSIWILILFLLIPFNLQADEPNGNSTEAGITSDASKIIFTSAATNLIPGENGQIQIYLYKTSGPTLQTVSRSTAGVLGDSTSRSASITPDGRYVVFEAAATNLVAGDTNGKLDVFVRDLLLCTTERVSLSNNGGQSACGGYDSSISDDGRYISFTSGSNLEGVPSVTCDPADLSRIYVRDRIAGTTIVVSRTYLGTPPDLNSNSSAISGDGNSVYFTTAATNMLASMSSTGFQGYVWDIAGSSVELVSQSTGGAQGNSSVVTARTLSPTLSYDGRYVLFSSNATNLVAGDTNGVYDAFLRDRTGATTIRISVDAAGAQINDHSFYPVFSHDYNKVNICSVATNFAPGATGGFYQVYLKDPVTNAVERLSVSTAGTIANNDQCQSQSSLTGRYTAFNSLASNLAAGDTNGLNDIYLRDIVTPSTIRISQVFESEEVCVAPTATPTPTSTSTSTPTNTSTSTPTNTPTSTSTPTKTPVPVPPTATPTRTLTPRPMHSPTPTPHYIPCNSCSVDHIN